MISAPRSPISERGEEVGAIRRLRIRAGRQDPEVLETHLANLAKGDVRIVVHQQRDDARRFEVRVDGDPLDVSDFVETLRREPGVQVMHDEVLSLPGMDDPLYPDAAPLRRIAARGSSRDERPLVTDPVIVAIVDSGVMTTHPDLADRLSSGISLIPGTSIEDDDGHGTLLAGTVLAATGRSPAVRLMSVKFIDGRTRPESDRAADAIRWASGQGAHIINLSWELGIAKPALRAAIEEAGRSGALVVVAAGNSGADNDARPTFPACYGHDGCQAPPGQGLPNVITVMASDAFDDKPGFSNYGNKSVHIAAPGVGVISTHQTLRHGLRSGDPGLYQCYDGSSAATAYVTGAAALLRAAHPDLSPEEVRRVLIHSADPRSDLRCQGGRLNVARAREAAARLAATRGGPRPSGAG